MNKKILLIGTGRWGMNHLRTLLKMGVDLYVAESNEAAHGKCREMGLAADHITRNYRDFLSKVDAIDLVTPVETHHPIGCEAMEAGKDLFVEKPVAATYRESRAMVDLAAARKRILQVGHVFRYEAPTQFLKKLIASGELGEVKWIRGNFSAFKRPRTDCGVTMADAIHFVDLYNYLLGSLPTAANARLLDVLGRKNGMDDNAWLWLDYGGIFASIEVGVFSPVKTREVLVVGTRKSVQVDYMAKQDKASIFDNHHAKEKGQWTAVEGEVKKQSFAPEEPLMLELKAFLESMETRATPLADGAAGAEAVRIVEACIEANRSGKAMHLAGG
jgi:UDP-2-acetamido-3-amino-2,3-dideoxy-glucuronate N-acetyltransferase